VDPFKAVPDRYLLLFVCGSAFIALFCLGLVVFSPLFDYARHRRRVAQVDQFGLQTVAAPSMPAAGDRSLTQAALTVSTKLVRSGGWEEGTAQRLDRAGMRMRPGEWVLVRVAVFVVAVLAFALALGPLFGIPIGALVGYGATELYRRIRTERRYQAFAAQLPDSLQLIIGQLRSGFSFPQAIDAMVREAEDPIGVEFSRALAETRIGAEIEDALARLAVRMRSKDLEWVVMAVRIQREVGGNLAEVLSTNVATMRERESLRRHVRALSAEGRLSAYILVPLPFVIMIIMLGLRRAFIMPLFTTVPGILMLVLVAVLEVVGGLWMAKLTKVEV
jgi:tight adherence protein B